MRYALDGFNLHRHVIFTLGVLLPCLLIGVNVSRAQQSEAAPSASGSEESSQAGGQTVDAAQANRESREALEEAGTTHLLGISIRKADEGGALITEVDPLSPAWKAGLRKGDRIVKLGDFKTDDYPVFLKGVRELVQVSKGGDKINVSFLRDGELVEAVLVDKKIEEETKPNNDAKGETDQDDGRQPAEGSPMDLLGKTSAPGSYEGAPAAGQDLSYQDTDYYFGSGGAYGSALTASQQEQFDRLSRIRARDGLTRSQEQQLNELSALELGQFQELPELNANERDRMQDLLSRFRESPDQLTLDDRAELRQLVARRYSRQGDVYQYRDRLESLAREGRLEPEMAEQLQNLQLLGPNPNDRVNAERSGDLRELFGGGSREMTSPEGGDRFRDLESRRASLQGQELSEYQQLMLQRQSRMAQQLRDEYSQAQRLMQSGAVLTPAQQARLQQLESSQFMFRAGVNRPLNPNVPIPDRATATQTPQPSNTPGRRGPGQSGSGIGLGGQPGSAGPE